MYGTSTAMFVNVEEKETHLPYIWYIQRINIQLPPTQSQYIKPNMTATSPALMPAISLLPDALPLVLDGLAADPVGEELLAAVVVGTPPLASSTCPMLGNWTLPLTSQPPAVEAGHAGAVRSGVYAELGVPVGVRVAHCFERLEKSGWMGVGVPLRTTPPPDAVAAALGP